MVKLALRRHWLNVEFLQLFVFVIDIVIATVRRVIGFLLRPPFNGFIGQYFVRISNFFNAEESITVWNFGFS